MTSFKEQISAIVSSIPDPLEPVLLYFFAILKKCYAAAYHTSVNLQKDTLWIPQNQLIQLMHYIQKGVFTFVVWFSWFFWTKKRNWYM